MGVYMKKWIVLILLLSLFGCAKDQVKASMYHEYTLEGIGQILVFTSSLDYTLIDRLVIVQDVRVEDFLEVESKNEVKAYEYYRRFKEQELISFSDLPSTALSLFEDYRYSSKKGKMLSISIANQLSEISGIEHGYRKILHFDFTVSIDSEPFHELIRLFNMEDAFEGYRSMNYYLLKKSDKFAYGEIFKRGSLYEKTN